MNRFRRYNPDDYGGMPSLLLHLHNKRKESTNIPECVAAGGRNGTVSTRLAEVGKPLEEGGEVKEIQTSVEQFVSELLEIVGILEGRFISTIIPCGSFYEGTKVTAPDEFDFMAEIQVLSFRGACSILWNSGFPGCPLVRLHPFLAIILFNDLFDDPVSQNFALSTSKFRKSFKETLLMALEMMDLPPCWSSVGIEKKEKGPAILLGLTWNGLKYNNFDITIDITPTIKFHHWPHWTDISASTPTAPGASLEAVEERCMVAKNLGPCKSMSYEVLRYNRAASDDPPSGPPVDYALSKKGEAPSLQAPLLPLPLEKVTKLGFHVVPSSPFWRASFSVAELLILKKFSPDSNRLICYRCAKYLRDQHHGLGDHKVLSSYQLKTSFLFELEKFPEDKFWDKYEMFARLYGMLFRLLRESKEDMVCSYFVSTCYVVNKQLEEILPHAVQRVLDDLLLLISRKPKEQCCHPNSASVNRDYYASGGGSDDDDSDRDDDNDNNNVDDKLQKEQHSAEPH